MKVLLSTLWHYSKRWPTLIIGYIVTTVAVISLWVIDPLFARFVIDQVEAVISGEYTLEAFLKLFGIWIALSIALSLVQALQKMVCWRLLNYAYINFQRETYAHILHMDVMQHIQRRAGAIIKKIDNAADQIWDLGFQIFQVMIPSVIAAVIFLWIAFAVHAQMTLIVCIVLALYASVLAFVTKKAHPLQRDISRIWVSVIGRAYDVASNILPTKSAAGEAREIQRMKN